MDPGRLDKRVAILRRLERPGGGRTPYEEVFRAWGRFIPASAREVSEGGQAVNVESGTLLVRTNGQTRSITSMDRVLLDGRSFAIEGVQVPDRRTGLIGLSIATKLGGQ